MKPNPAVPEAVWEKFVSLPSQTAAAQRATGQAPDRAGARAGVGRSPGRCRPEGARGNAQGAGCGPGALSRADRRRAQGRADGRRREPDADLRGKGKSLDDFWERPTMRSSTTPTGAPRASVSPDLARTYAEARRWPTRPQRGCDKDEALIGRTCRHCGAGHWCRR